MRAERKGLLKIEEIGIYVPSGNNWGEQGCDVFLGILHLYLGPSIA